VPAHEQENLRLAESLVRANEECDRLREVVRLSAMALRVQTAAILPELLETLSKQVLGMQGVDGLVVNLMKDSRDALTTVFLKLPEVFAGIQSSYKGFQYHVDQADVNVRVFNDGKFAIVGADDLGNFAETTRMRFIRWKMRSLVVVPVTVALEDHTIERIGALMVFSQNQTLDEHLAHGAQKIGDFFARQIRIHWNYNQTVERGKLAEAMYGEIQQFLSYISEMSGLTSVGKVYALIGREFIQRFGFDMVSILMEEGGRLPIVHAAFSESFEHLAERFEPFRKDTVYSLEIRDGQSGFVFLPNQRFLINDMEKIRDLPMSEKDARLIALLESTRTFLYVPIRLSGKVIGVVWLATLTEPLNAPETDLTLIELLSSFISTSIRNAKLHGDVEQKNVQIESLNQELQGKIVLLAESMMLCISQNAMAETELKKTLETGAVTHAAVLPSPATG
jgi:GAF domain-containing protein